MNNMNLFVGNDMEIRVDGLRNGTSGAEINTATVTATILDSTPATVSGTPVTLSYVSGTNGDYSATFEDTLGLTVGSRYTVVVAITGDGLTAKYTQDVIATHRRF